jgi:hypothetical protein
MKHVDSNSTAIWIWPEETALKDFFYSFGDKGIVKVLDDPELKLSGRTVQYVFQDYI